ncbi:hypothetical protein HJC23_014060 [Cyclotella cryptica]|uniref:Uncharacterized protein n=1 Tax=Cyclotella cryptica TaxID=29204 RepID=A0ABD3QTM5_9STRA|eukprot:CCRYP_002452-RA/>CCRYP_002452-RA protein AED:0.36 eAED:0.36 QI:0/-1/0/1/-1/1/1/0/461
MTKALLITIASLAAALESGHLALAKTNELRNTPANELLVFRRNLGKSDKAGHHIVPPPPPMGKSGKGAKHGAIPPPNLNSGWTGSDGDDDDFSQDDGYEWVGSGSDDDGNAASGDGNPSMDDDDDDDHSSSWVDDGHNFVPSGKGSKEQSMPEQWNSQWSGGSNDDDDHQSWSGDDHHHTKSGKGHKSAKVGKAGKSMKAGKGSHITENWRGWGSWPVPISTVPSPVPTPCGEGGKDCSEKPGWLPESPTMAPTPCGKAGKECPTPIPPPGPKPSPLPQTLPPICNTIPCSINGVPVTPTTSSGDTSGSTATEPPVPAPIGMIGLTTNPPVEPTVEGIISQPPNGASGNPTVSDVIGAPPPVPPTPLVPITVAPTAPTESKSPTFYPTMAPTTTIQTLTTSGTWFQTGKAYEVDSYTRARMGDQNDIGFSFAKQEVTAGSRRLSPLIVSSVGMMAMLLGQL